MIIRSWGETIAMMHSSVGVVVNQIMNIVRCLSLPPYPLLVQAHHWLYFRMSFAPFQSWPTQNMEWIMSVFRKIDIPTDRICMSDYSILPWTLKSFHPEVIHPEVILPEVILPEVIHPEVIHPDVIHPEVILPEVIHPEVFRPKVIYPKVIHPVWETQKVNLIMLVSLFCFSSLNVLWGVFLGGAALCWWRFSIWTRLRGNGVMHTKGSFSGFQFTIL